MIVNYKEDGWQIISQRAHGLLAGEICSNWKKKSLSKRWFETIIAATEHDDVFNEFEDGEIVLNENGGPVNFKMRAFEKEKCDRLLRQALSKSRYIALLIAHHIHFLHANSEDKEAAKYCKNLKNQEKVWRSDIDITEEEIAKAYAIIEWCDAFSLLICQQFIQPENRKIEISKGPDDLCYQLHAPKENILTVNPWPFETNRFELHYESRTLTQLKFKNEEEFRQILMETTPEIHCFQLIKQEK